MTIITLRQTALALYRKPKTIQFAIKSSTPPPNYHDVCIYSHPIVTTCLYTSALLVAELGSYLPL